MCHIRILLCLLGVTISLEVTAAEMPLRIATFQADITPPLGAPLCDALVEPAKEIVDRLTARGIIYLTDQKPIVVCAMDWVGVGNQGYEAFREALARAANTTRERVSVHCLHQHDAPGFDPAADEILAAHGLEGKLFDMAFSRMAIKGTADAVTEALKHPQQVTHLGMGRGRVEKVASNRRVMGPDGKVKFVRYSSCTDEAVRAEPEGIIDPYLQLISLWDGDRPLVAISYYATHPQSYYGEGAVSADFVGMARALREAALPQVPHIHFNGAGGNVTAGKYNDGSPPLRPILAERLAAGAKMAWDHMRKVPIRSADVEWRVIPVALPLARHLVVADVEARIANEKSTVIERLRAGRDMAWLQRSLRGDKIEIAMLRLGPAYILHMPGELFVEYQLAAQALRPQDTVCMAAYGDYGPGYIGTTAAYPQGGYETGIVSRVDPSVEEVLMAAIKELLK